MATGRKGTMVLKFTNSLTQARTLILEPWTGEYSIAPGNSVELVAEGPPPQNFEIELLEDTVVVYALGGEGTDVRVFRDGEEVAKSE